MNIRRAEFKDLTALKTCNALNVFEDYPINFWTRSLLTWPELCFLAEDTESGKVVGYVLGAIERSPVEQGKSWFGEFNGVCILKPYRRLGLARRMMTLSKEAMLRTNFEIQYIELYVRKSNRAAISLYKEKMEFHYHHTEKEHYGDSEDALIMRHSLKEGLNVGRQHTKRSRRKRRMTWFQKLMHLVQDGRRWLVEATETRFQRSNTVP